MGISAREGKEGNMNKTPKEILQYLQYRIDTTAEDEPERENAIRLRDRLLAKYGLSLEDITDARSERVFDRLTSEECALVWQYFLKTLNTEADAAPYNCAAYAKRHSHAKHNSSVEIRLTDDEYRHHFRIVMSLIGIHRNKMRELEKKLKAEADARRKALNYAIYEKAGILFPSNGDASPKAPEWTLNDAINAARELDGVIFPQMQLDADRLRIGNS